MSPTPSLLFWYGACAAASANRYQLYPYTFAFAFGCARTSVLNCFWSQALAFCWGCFQPPREATADAFVFPLDFSSTSSFLSTSPTATLDERSFEGPQTGQSTTSLARLCDPLPWPPLLFAALSRLGGMGNRLFAASDYPSSCPALDWSILGAALRSDAASHGAGRDPRG